jgi:predicted RNA-binding protein with PUA-like domain
MKTERRYWLMKSEPEAFSIDDLARSPRKTTCWDGVRNYQARNFMREMKVGDRVLYYHSGGDEPAVVGTAVVAREAYADHTAWDPKNDHYDAKASTENPIWQMVDIRYESTFPAPISLAKLRELPALKNMELLRRGSRLSVQPVSEKELAAVEALANAGAKLTAKTAKGAKATATSKANKKKPAARKVAKAR